MSGLIFDEKTLYDGNIFKFENRLQSHVNKFIENGAILTTYYSQDEKTSTVDRGLQNIDELFGNHSPLRFHKINNLPLYGFGQTNPENSEEAQIEDIDVEGSCVIVPMTVIPKPYDMFVIKHLKMIAIFQVKSVMYDSMKQNGYYKIDYRLHSTSNDLLNQLEKQVVSIFHTDLNLIGTMDNPIIKEEDFILRGRIEKMINQMIKSYISLFYNDKHNCFLFNNTKRNEIWFDVCANQFMQQYALMNFYNSGKCIVLTKKIDDSNMMLFYNNSIFNWIEMQCPTHLLQKFKFTLKSSNLYPYSSFFLWSDEVQIMQPLNVNDDELFGDVFSYFNDTQFESLLNKIEPIYDYEKLIYKFINNEKLHLSDISLHLGDALFSSMKHLDIYLYTPIIIYILRTVLNLY